MPVEGRRSGRRVLLVDGGTEFGGVDEFVLFGGVIGENVQ